MLKSLANAHSASTRMVIKEDEAEILRQEILEKVATTSDAATMRAIAELFAREEAIKEVTVMALDGDGGNEIAEKLGLTYKQVKNHMTCIMRRHGVGNMTELSLAVDGPVPADAVFRVLDAGEQQIARLLFAGKAEKEIAHVLGVAENAIAHRKVIMNEKLAVAMGEEPGPLRLPKLLKRLRLAIIPERKFFPEPVR